MTEKVNVFRAFEAMGNGRVVESCTSQKYFFNGVDFMESSGKRVCLTHTELSGCWKILEEYQSPLGKIILSLQRNISIARDEGNDYSGTMAIIQDAEKLIEIIKKEKESE